MPTPAIRSKRSLISALALGLVATFAAASVASVAAAPSTAYSSATAPAARIEPLEAFSDPSELWGNGVGAAIERAFRACFKTYIVDGQVLTLRIPFAQNNERAELAGTDLEIPGGGKAEPAALWETIDAIVASDDFGAYVSLLGDGRDTVFVFDLPSRTWSVSRDLFDIARMKAGAYRGLPHRPYVLSTGTRVKPSDIYNYLYCVGRVGMDCSGFVWHVLSSTARAGGLDLGRVLRQALRAPRGADPSLFVGTAFFDSRSTELVQVRDQVRNLQPADVILFRGEDGAAVHSAVIQSVDLAAGVIRYLQCTDEAPPDERGVHESFIRFDPGRPELSLKDASLSWSQSRFPPFAGERASAFSNDGERYRAFPELGGGKVVRLKAMAAPLRRISSGAGR